MGDDGGGSLISLDGVASSRTVFVSASIMFPCTIKSRRFLLLAPAHPCSPRKRAIKRLCVCYCLLPSSTDWTNRGWNAESPECRTKFWPECQSAGMPNFRNAKSCWVRTGMPNSTLEGHMCRLQSTEVDATDLKMGNHVVWLNTSHNWITAPQSDSRKL